ncbi:MULTISPECIES: hypothetical protein [unclassified Psychrobacillus]|uniref:hypothetical protein n=1 Tax=unclassified Psychrobacillus TaxID=2636677 RepID=UPI0030F6229A
MNSVEMPEHLKGKKINQAILARYKDIVWFVVAHKQEIILSNLTNTFMKEIMTEAFFIELFYQGRIQLAFDVVANLDASFISVAEESQKTTNES